MSRVALAGLALLAFATAAPVAGYTTERPKPNSYTIIDRQGFDGPTPAITYRLPRGWKARGNIRWHKPCSFQKLYVTLFRATSPDGRRGLRLSPGFVFSMMGADPPGVDPLVDNMVATTLRQQRAANAKSNCFTELGGDMNRLAQRLVVARRATGARLISITHDREHAQQMKDNMGGDSTVHPNDRFDVEAAVVRVAYDSASGPVEEDVALQVISQRVYLPGVNGVATWMDTVSVFPLVRFWAPLGELDRNKPLLSKILASGKEHEHWASEIKKLRAKYAEASAEEAKERTKQWEERQRRSSEDNKKFIDAVIWGQALKLLGAPEEG